jgi:transcription elongation factor GreA
MSSGNLAGGDAITPEGLRALKSEIAALEGPGRREIASRILTARELGDLKENAEYHSAKEDQAHLETRIKRLRQRLREAVVVEADSGEVGTFAFGRTAEVHDEDTGEVKTWTIVGPTEADIAEGKLSSASPIAKALIDQPEGATVAVVTPRGTRRFRIASIR